MLHIEIESTNECNTRCLHCPRESITRPMGKMDWNTYRAIMDKALAHDRDMSVEFAGMGEPLLNSLTYRFIGYISDRAWTSLTTNASALTPQNVKRLIEAGLDRLTLSFNGADKETYELMMGGLDFVRAENYLRTAVEMSQGQRMEVAANISVTKQVQTQLPAIRDYLTRAGVKTIFFSRCHSRGGNLNNPAVCATPMPPSWASSRCDVFTSTIFVAWNGDVLSCCHDLTGANKLGNLVTDELEMVLSRSQRIAEDGVNFAICQRCNDMYRYMHAPTPDSSPLSEWIYSLYASEDERTQKLTDHICELDAQISAKEETIRTLNAQLAEKEQSLQMSNRQLAEILNTRSWWLMRTLQRIRLWLMPRGSLRERLIFGSKDSASVKEEQ